jgi:hypothetical protein
MITSFNISHTEIYKIRVVYLIEVTNSGTHISVTRLQHLIVNNLHKAQYSKY